MANQQQIHGCLFVTDIRDTFAYISSTHSCSDDTDVQRFSCNMLLFAKISFSGRDIDSCLDDNFSTRQGWRSLPVYEGDYCMGSGRLGTTVPSTNTVPVISAVLVNAISQEPFEGIFVAQISNWTKEWPDSDLVVGDQSWRPLWSLHFCFYFKNSLGSYARICDKLCSLILFSSRLNKKCPRFFFGTSRFEAQTLWFWYWAAGDPYIILYESRHTWTETATSLVRNHEVVVCVIHLLIFLESTSQTPARCTFALHK